MAVRCSVSSILLLTALVGTSSLAVAGSSLASRARKDPECGSALWCTDDSCRSPECVCVPFTPAAPQFGFCVDSTCFVGCTTDDDCCKDFTCTNETCVFVPPQTPM